MKNVNDGYQLFSRCDMNEDEDDESNRELVEVNSVEGEVLVVDGVQGAPNHSGFHLWTRVEI